MTEEEWAGGNGIFEDEDEKKHLFSVLDSFRQYRRAAHFNVTHVRRQQFYALPQSQWEALTAPPISFLSTLNKIDDAIDTNADLADAILETGLTSFNLPSTSDVPKGTKPPWLNTATKLDLDKARSTIHQLYRDWSHEGAAERSVCYNPVFQELSQRFPNPSTSNPRALVPGAGLSRLVFELAVAGYTAEGNELSYHQLLTSSFILNHTTSANQYAIYPFASIFSNNISRSDQLRRILVPDVHPASVDMKGSMSMSTGDFVAVYGKDQEEHKSAFDAVVTVFFVDTAPNILTYIETIKHCLRPGGYWINLGPLLWHFGDGGTGKSSNQRDQHEEGDDHTEQAAGSTTNDDAKIGSHGSIELTDEEVVALVRDSGFEIEKHKVDGLQTGYVQNTRSMLRNTYHPSHWVARKL